MEKGGEDATEDFFSLLFEFLVYFCFLSSVAIYMNLKMFLSEPLVIYTIS